MENKEIDSMKVIENKEGISDIIKMYFKINQLKNLYRQGWLKFKGNKFKAKCESVAEHCFSLALLVDSYIKIYKIENVDLNKCIKMSLIHELGEIVVGDYTPIDNITKEEKRKIEEEAVEKLLKEFDYETEYLELWKDYEYGKTKEAKLVKILDKFEFLMQGACYNYNIEIFKYSLSQINEHILLKLIEELKEITKNGDVEYLNKSYDELHESPDNN